MCVDQVKSVVVAMRLTRWRTTATETAVEVQKKEGRRTQHTTDALVSIRITDMCDCVCDCVCIGQMRMHRPRRRMAGSGHDTHTHQSSI